GRPRRLRDHPGGVPGVHPDRVRPGPRRGTVVVAVAGGARTGGRPAGPALSPSGVQDVAQQPDERAGLIALHRVPGVGDHVNALEPGCGAGEFGGVLVVDEGRPGAPDQGGGGGEAGDVVPQTLKPVTLADGVVAPRPGAVVELFG